MSYFISCLCDSICGTERRVCDIVRLIEAMRESELAIEWLFLGQAGCFQGNVCQRVLFLGLDLIKDSDCTMSCCVYDGAFLRMNYLSILTCLHSRFFSVLLQDGWTSMMASALFGHEAVVVALQGFGADVNAKDNVSLFGC